MEGCSAQRETDFLPVTKLTMVTINVAYTEHVNPSGVTPILTRDQIWKGKNRWVENPPNAQESG